MPLQSIVNAHLCKAGNVHSCALLSFLIETYSSLIPHHFFRKRKATEYDFFKKDNFERGVNERFY